MAAKRDLTIAYNGYVIGGESAVAFPLDQVRLRETYYRVEAECDVLVAQTSQQLLAAEAVSIEAALKAKSKNLGITSGQRIGAADGVANGTTTFTSATGGFVAGDVGLPINIEGKGAFQIVTVNGATSVVLSTTVASGTGLTWRVGHVLLQATPSLNTQGGFVRCSLDKPGSADHDSPLTRKYAFRAGYERPADNTNDGFRREAQVSIAYSGSRQRIVTFTGTYTAGGGNTALANYLANSAAWISARLSEVSGTATFERVAEPTVFYDDERQLAQFDVRYREILFAQDLTTTDNSSIVGDAIAFRRSGIWAHGKDGASIAPVRGVLSYACEVDATVTGATGLAALYTGKIKPFLVSKAQSLLGGTVVIETEDATLDASTNRITAMLGVLLAGLGSGVIEYTETVGYSFDSRITLRKVWDGQEDTYNTYSPGHQIMQTRTIVVDQLGASGPSSAAGQRGTSGASSVVSGGLDLSSRQGAFGGINLFGAQGSDPTSGGTSGSRGGGDRPPARFGAGDGKWLVLNEQQIDGPTRYLGHDIDGAGAVTPVFRTSTVTTSVWVSSSSGTIERPTTETTAAERPNTRTGMGGDPTAR